MFPITVHLTITNPAQLFDLAKLLAGGAAHMSGPQTGQELITSPAAIEAALADTVDPPRVASNDKADIVRERQLEAPGKPSAAATARSRPTAAAAPSPSAAPPAPAAAPAPKAETPAEPTTAPPATAPSAPSPAEEVSYDQLRDAVNARITKVGLQKLSEVCAKHGAATFKALPKEKWAAALADVLALGD